MFDLTVTGGILMAKEPEQQHLTSNELDDDALEHVSGGLNSIMDENGNTLYLDDDRLDDFLKYSKRITGM